MNRSSEVSASEFPAPLEIARREEGRQALGTAEVAPVAVELAGGWMTCAGPGSWANQVAGVGLGAPLGHDEADALVAQIVDFYVARGIEPKVEAPAVIDKAFLEALGRRGFVVAEFGSVLWRGLSDTAEAAALEVPGLEIVAVDPSETERLEHLVEVWNLGFEQPSADEDPESAALTRRIVAHPRCEALLALVDGEPAGVGVIEVLGDHAGLFGVTVLPQFRRRGVQQALIVERLRRARARGVRTVCVQGAAGGPTERNAYRHGFRLAYSKAALVLRGPGLVPSR